MLDNGYKKCDTYISKMLPIKLDLPYLAFVPTFFKFQVISISLIKMISNLLLHSKYSNKLFPKDKHLDVAKLD